MKGEIVMIAAGKNGNEDWRHPPNQFLYQKTGPDGVATFHLGTISGGTILIQDDSGVSARCSGGEVSVAALLANGLLAPNRCGNLSGPIPVTKPGEVVLISKHLSWWKRGQS